MKTMKYCCENHILVSIFENDSDEPDECWAGYIQCCNEEEILFSHITPDGEDDGFVWKRVDSIYEIDYSGKYERRLEYLYHYKNPHQNEFKGKDSFLLESLLNNAIEGRAVICCRTPYMDIMGYVKDFDNDVLIIQEVSEYGEILGMSSIAMEEVETVMCNGVDEQSRKLLCEYKGEKSFIRFENA